MNATSLRLLNVATETAFRVGALAMDLAAGAVLLLSAVLTALLVITLLIATATYGVFGRWNSAGTILLEMAAEPVPTEGARGAPLQSFVRRTAFAMQHVGSIAAPIAI